MVRVFSSKDHIFETTETKAFSLYGIISAFERHLAGNRQQPKTASSSLSLTTSRLRTSLANTSSNYLRYVTLWVRGLRVILVNPIDLLKPKELAATFASQS